jgi:AcrR family transcriptional regulator
MPPRRRTERLLAIVDAATEVFAQKGFAAAQMTDVARMASVSVGTLYNYVEGKEALLLLSAERPFIDIGVGREYPIAAPNRVELISRLEGTLTEHVRVPALERALAQPVQEEQLDAQIGDIVGELFGLIASTRVGADALEKSARDAPDLAALFYLHIRVRLVEQLVRYLETVDATRRIPAPVTPEYGARFLLETVTWWARHRHRDPDPPKIDESQARDVAVALVSGFLSSGPAEQ